MLASHYLVFGSLGAFVLGLVLGLEALGTNCSQVTMLLTAVTLGCAEVTGAPIVNASTSLAWLVTSLQLVITCATSALSGTSLSSAPTINAVTLGTWLVTVFQLVAIGTTPAAVGSTVVDGAPTVDPLAALARYHAFFKMVVIVTCLATPATLGKTLLFGTCIVGTTTLLTRDPTRLHVMVKVTASPAPIAI